MLVDFYRLPFQFESRIRPDSPAALEAVAGSPVTADVNIPNTFDKVATFDRDLSIEFSDYNYAVIAGYGFWFFAHTHKANREPVIACTFTRDPWYEYGKSKVKALMDAMPTYTPPYLPFVIANGNTGSKNTDIVSLSTYPRVKLDGIDYGIYWFEMKIRETTGYVFKYGGFVRIAADDPFGYKNFQSVNLCRMKRSADDTTGANIPLADLLYNTDQLVKKIKSTWSADNVEDIAISDICPYKSVKETIGGISFYNLLDPSGNVFYPTQYGPFYLYYVTNEVLAFNTNDIVHRTFTGNEYRKFIYNARSEIKDGCDNLVAILPKISSSDETINITIRTISDDSGITSYLQFDSWSADFVIPHGHLPYAGSAWATYAKANLQYDRECMQINIDKANSEALLSAGSSVASGAAVGAISGNAAGIVTGLATTGIGLATSMYSNQISADALRKEQSAKENLYKLSNATSYSTGYGLTYPLLASLRGTRIEHARLMIDDDDEYQTMYDEYIRTHGYPAVGRRTVTLSPGFWKGYAEMIMSETGPIVIPKLMHDILNQELTQGIRLVHGVNDI